MRIGELARRSGLTAHTIRYYEREGLLPLPGRTPGGFREYARDALEDLRFIRKARALGLRLRDIRETMEIAAGGRKPCEHVRATLTERLAEVEARMRELRALRETLRKTLRRLDGAAASGSRGRCSIIESL